MRVNNLPGLYVKAERTTVEPATFELRTLTIIPPDHTIDNPSQPSLLCCLIPITQPVIHVLRQKVDFLVVI